MSENGIGSDADPERARGSSPILPGGECQRVAGWIAFAAAALLRSPLRFLAVLGLPLDCAAPLFGFSLSMSAFYAVIRLYGLPRMAWVGLAILAIAAVLLSLALNLGDRPDRLWPWHFPLFLSIATVIQFPLLPVALYRMWRLTRPQDAANAPFRPAPTRPGPPRPGARQQERTPAWMPGRSPGVPVGWGPD